MPRLLVNGFPETVKACILIRVNSSAKGSGSQPKVLFDKTIQPTDGIYELPFEKIYLGSSIRLEVNIPGFITIDTNVQLSTQKCFTSLLLLKLNEPELAKIEGCYGATETWQAIQCKALYKSSKLQFQKMVAAERRDERNTFIAAMSIVLLFAAIIYLITGPVGVLVLVIFAFYYHEKNKLNKWSDATK